MDNRNRSVHNKELAYCKESPTETHHWDQTVAMSPIFCCRYCRGFRAFNIRYTSFNIYSSPKFMKVFTLETLPTLMSMIDRRHKDKDVDILYMVTGRESAYKHKPIVLPKKGIFEKGPRLPKGPKVINLKLPSE